MESELKKEFMMRTDTTPQHYAFLNYLTGKFGAEAEILAMVETAEKELPGVLSEYFGVTLGSIYDLTDSAEIDRLRKLITTHPILKSVDMNAEPRYTEVLRWYRLFVMHADQPVKPYAVEGETEGTEMASEDRSNTRTTEQTIYLEGEAAENQSADLRRRNMHLRQACISYYKMLHGGRLVCECCGFDFQRAYAISDEYIEVHHQHPFSHTEGQHEVCAETDLVPLCANCHRMIHHGQGGHGNCRSLDELKRIYRGKHYD